MLEEYLEKSEPIVQAIEAQRREEMLAQAAEELPAGQNPLEPDIPPEEIEQRWNDIEDVIAEQLVRDPTPVPLLTDLLPDTTRAEIAVMGEWNQQMRNEELIRNRFIEQNAVRHGVEPDADDIDALVPAQIAAQITDEDRAALNEIIQDMKNEDMPEFVDAMENIVHAGYDAKGIPPPDFGPPAELIVIDDEDLGNTFREEIEESRDEGDFLKEFELDVSKIEPKNREKAIKLKDALVDLDVLVQGGLDLHRVKPLRFNIPIVLGYLVSDSKKLQTLDWRFRSNENDLNAVDHIVEFAARHHELYSLFGNEIKRILRKEYPIRKNIPKELKVGSGRLKKVVAPKKIRYTVDLDRTTSPETSSEHLTIRDIHRSPITEAQRRLLEQRERDSNLENIRIQRLRKK